MESTQVHVTQSVICSMLHLFLVAIIIAAGRAAVASPPAKIAVIGATGKVGRSAVQQLVSRGYKPRILLRHPASVPAPSSMPSADAPPAEVASFLASLPGVETISGDVTDPKSCEALVSGCSAVLALHGARRTRQLSDLWRNPEEDAGHAKQINYQGVANLIEAARASRTCKRIVRLTGKGETPWSIFSILINGLGSMAKAWNYEGERLLRACDDIEYTIVRPGVMRGEEADLPPASLVLGDDGADLKVTSIPHGSIAALCIDSLGYANAGRCTLCAMASEEPGTGADSWAPLLEKVAPDRRAFRDDLLAEHKRATTLGGAGLVVGLGAFASAVAAVVVLALKALAAAVLGLMAR